MSYAMYPAVFEEYAVHFNTFGDVSKLSSDMVGSYNAIEQGIGGLIKYIGSLIIPLHIRLSDFQYLAGGFSSSTGDSLLIII